MRSEDAAIKPTESDIRRRDDGEVLDFLNDLAIQKKLHIEQMSNGKMVVANGEIAGIGYSVREAAKALRSHIIDTVGKKLS